jgi:formylglycine-generating enzyme required for sulfatase activity
MPRAFSLMVFNLVLVWCLAARAQLAATAVATITDGSVTGVMVTSGGSGYVAAPAVAFVGGGGTGAGAIAHVSGGAVDNIVIQSPGSGYTNAPVVAIAPPPPPASPAILSLSLVPELVITGQAWQVQEVQYANALGDTNQWFTWTNIVMGNSPVLLFDTSTPPDGTRFYQVVTLGAPEPDPSRWAWINPGTFTMGSPDTEYDRSTWEGPQTQVTFTNGFWIERFLVTQGEYLALVGTNPSSFTNDLNLPVEQVTWFDASNYCAVLTAQEQAAGQLPPGYVYRLPTEAEWEYATRAGTTTRFFFGDDLAYTQVLNYGWIQTNSDQTTHDVGQKLPNQWGLYDTSGNVFEWCASAFTGQSPLYETYPGGSVTNPFVPAFGTYVVIRGGSWFQAGYYARSAARGWYSSGSETHAIGFRVVLGPPLNYNNGP